MLIKWEELPQSMQTAQVKEYYDLLKTKRVSLFLKRVVDVLVSLLMLILLSPVFLILAIAIKSDSEGPIFYRQVRITQGRKEFRIHKFRSMVVNADRKGALVTTHGDVRVTKIGTIIRKYRLDEISQLIDILQGTMSFVGTRPEVPKYVAHYTPEMMATLLLPAGVTSIASVMYKDESDLLEGVDDPDQVYIEKILPEKMKYNLLDLRKFSLLRDFKILFMTVAAISGKEFKDM